ncbi:heptaprenyl diphosphate synthase component II [Oceanobacillus caeni]|uniref:Heptaprenyl diphosphate synthase n=2 Tax=Oceanobacillus caeni TaxID=405946 RepID=A0ABR5MK11_9BACI|nr:MULTISPECIES: heptaprenyl diphosphate synthase component II [Bacillaceae]KKE79341.1 heptaprenyl diphosphate synthase [Bacilli bacterium VT-13-104]PZD88368.1 heptaprenyl diphosphate synthase component II [Bacilli bacterium]KPH76032.1 heptaprenyl diphosphate synthase [Oceanobacillus caeni]MBU8789728.1 heptaprenyl diphosphate synthase component II [Oceanobacillus caeni]MCR1834343.1 heptaprenyl diphosphate synthase component II [Oceanobacillus caeni]
MKLPKTYGYLKKDLDFIETSLHQTIQANHPILRNASTELLNAGGKRIRPVFVLLSGQLGEFDIEKIKKVAVSLELIHMATLVHDDVIDEAELRRGKPTIKKRFGNRVAMYTGDYILARALEEITSLKNPNVHRILSKTIVEVCIGEIEQMKDRFNWNQDLKNYLRRIKRKTALLIATSCQLGGVVSGLSDKESRKMFQYGYYIGMSYQIIDDILDFTSTSKVLGKPAGNDLLQGNITLPILYGMQNEDFNRLLKRTFHNPENVSKKEMNEIINKLQSVGAIEKSYELSELYLKKALHTLKSLPDKKARKTLEDIAKYIGKRRS